MTIKQLKQILNNMDENLKVFIYAETAEDWGEANLVLRREGKSEFPYSKGDIPSGLEGKSYLVISGPQNHPTKW